MYTIKAYTKEDFDILKKWYAGHNEWCPEEEKLSPTTFFVLEKGTPIAALSLYLTNCKAIGWLENFISDPQAKNRKEATGLLVSFIENYAKECGVKRLIGFTTKATLSKRYADLGYSEAPKQSFVVSKEL